jgi:hypothetical protein
VKAFGPEEKETIKQWKKLNTEYNIAAMKYLQMDDHNMVCRVTIKKKLSGELNSLLFRLWSS